jgi:hypothetical protein
MPPAVTRVVVAGTAVAVLGGGTALGVVRAGAGGEPALVADAAEPAAPSPGVDRERERAARGAGREELAGARPGAALSAESERLAGLAQAGPTVTPAPAPDPVPDATAEPAPEPPAAPEPAPEPPPAPEPEPVPGGTPDANRDLARSMIGEYGWGGDQWECLDLLWQQESSWEHTAENPSSGAYGIPQSLPASKMETHGGDWRTNPGTQIAWGLDYIDGRYGTPCSAWSFHLDNNWY